MIRTEDCLLRLTEMDGLWRIYTLRFTNSENFFQSCKAAAEELFREERGNELRRDLREMMRFVEP